MATRRISSPRSPRPRTWDWVTIGLSGGDGGKMKSSGVCDHILVRRTRSIASRNVMSPPTISFRSWLYATRQRSRLGEYEGSRGMKYVDEYRDRAKAKILEAAG